MKSTRESPLRNIFLMQLAQDEGVFFKKKKKKRKRENKKKKSTNYTSNHLIKDSN